MGPIPENSARVPHCHAVRAIEATLQSCFRLLVALALAAIVAGAFLALALGAGGPETPSKSDVMKGKAACSSSAKSPTGSTKPRGGSGM